MLLADLSTMFESFGLRMTAHRSPEFSDLLLGTGVVHEFEFGHLPIPDPVLALIAEACTAHATGAWRIDGYARLVATAGIPWREAGLLRAICRFLKQTPLGLPESSLVESLTQHPDFTRAVVSLFRARLDPSTSHDLVRREAADMTVAMLVEQAETLDEDRIRRAVHAFVSAVLRTNWFQLDAEGQAKSYIAFKIDSSRLATNDATVPFREIFVHSDEVEGVHLRNGAVARGGLRWSDRCEDFRTEALGLMKTQSVKNAPIVPAGAKGAFVIRSTETSAAEAYRIFIAGLLDLTDNIVDGWVLHPARTVCHDGADSYLVVAADKGTANFSDLANTIAVQRNFWLGDAFASGGSAGYSHKAMGITARGAWLSVRRHFAEAGRDIDAEEFTVVGIGDMSGDVFGNGMLLSRKIRLVGAFDHRHIFLDPDPDSEISFSERQRLFDTPHSSWGDYDTDKISSGGGVWPRTAKTIPLSPQIRDRLSIDTDECGPDELIQTILRAPVDLLWNGGIGTYVRAAGETDLDAHDPVNKRVRIAASELRCSVVGEGGNLGLTQHARVDFALAGGRINADFIDNAAGVATSDMEVNLKIALDAGVRAGLLTGTRRDELLHSVADDVVRRVLTQSANQILAISLAHHQAGNLLERHVRLIGNLQAQAGIDPVAEGLPSAAELERRAISGAGLTRPEIAILLAQSKNLVCNELLQSRVPDDELFADRLTAYFPAAVVEETPDLIAAHPLRREIIATAIADELINRIGPGTIYRLQERLGVSTAQVAVAYAKVRGILDLDALWEEGLGWSTDETELAPALFEIRELVEHLTSLTLRSNHESASPRVEIDRYTSSVRQLIGLTRSARGA
ncbi:NAD-glutamate dehydrogenase domain-containing protein [Nocardia tengchongensis]